MTVKELIDILSKLPQGAQVIVLDPWGDHLPAVGVNMDHQMNEVEIR